MTPEKTKEEAKKYLKDTAKLIKESFLPDSNLKDDFAVINLEPLCKIQQDTENKLQKFILEELFKVCTNDDFFKSVQEIRKVIQTETGIPIPSTDKNIVTVCRNILFETGKWKWYQSILEEIRQKHNLYGEAYEWDYISDHNYRSSYEINLDLVRDDALQTGKKLTKKELEIKAKKWTIDTAIEDELNFLETIIFYNNPVYLRNWMGLSSSNRGGFLKIDRDLLTEELFIQGKFYLNSSKADMLSVIKKNYKKITEERERRLRIKIKNKDAPKNKLLQSYRVFQLKKQNMTLPKIALQIEEEGLSKEYVSENHLRLILERIREDNKRFDSIKTR